MGLGKYGGGMETIEHPSLQWGKSFQAATKISAGEITLQSCCASWLTQTHVRVVMWYQVILLKYPNPILLSHDPRKGNKQLCGSRMFQEGKTLTAFYISDTFLLQMIQLWLFSVVWDYCVHVSRKYAYSPSCWELDKNINNTLISVHSIICWSQEAASLASHKAWKQGEIADVVK